MPMRQSQPGTDSERTNAPKAVYVALHGCCRRALDATRITNFFISNGVRIAANARDADTVVLVSCGYKTSRLQEASAIVARMKRLGVRVIVTGCVPSIAPERLRKADLLIPLRHMDSFDSLLTRPRIPFAAVPDANEVCLNLVRGSIGGILSGRLYPSLRYPAFLARAVVRRIRRIASGPTRAQRITALRIGHGCTGRCSYCGIRRAVGPLQSKPVEACLQEYSALLQHGCDLINIVSEDTGAYGIDIGTDFPALLRALDAASDGSRVSWLVTELNPIYAMRFRHAILEMIQKGRIRELGCTVQSGSPRLLELMNRSRDTQAIVESCAEFKQAGPMMCMSTHLLVGFPSETDEDIESTIDLVLGCRFDKVHLFQYGEMEGSLSSGIEPKVPVWLAKRRILRIVKRLSRNGFECITSDV